MIRLALLWLAVGGLALHARRDWYAALCGLIVMMAVIEHPDMPKTIFGVQGLNPWNAVFFCIVLGWAASRHAEGLVWDLPRHVTVLLLGYLAVVVVGVVRMLADPRDLDDVSTSYLISEYVVNCVKWVLPGLLLFDGCRTRRRFLMGLAALLAIYLLLGIQVIKWMPTSALGSGDSLSARAVKILVNETGYHRVNLSMMLAGSFWATLAAVPLAARRSHRLLILGAALVLVYAQALTGGRMGYATWALVGLILCVVKWRRYLLLVPFVALAIALVVPAAVERMTQGFSGDDSRKRLAGEGFEVSENIDEYTVMAGRNVAWPYVLRKIEESPVVGHGRQAMVTTGIARFLEEEFNENFPHPHNAYLEQLLDNGWVGLLVILPFYLVVLGRAFSLFRDPRSPSASAIGGAASALVLALLIAGLGSQTLYPREGAVGMWCAIGLVFRVAVERARALSRVAAPAPDPAASWWMAPAGGPPDTLERLLWPRPA